MSKREDAGRTYGGRAAEDRSAERRARFLEAGLALYGTQGFTGTTVRALCAEAGLTERYFYESFENREALFMDVAAACVTGLMEVLVAAQGRGEGDPDGRAMLEAFLRWFQGDPRRARIQLVEPLVMGARFLELYREVTAMFAGMLRATSFARYEATLREAALDPDLLATALVGAAVEVVKKWDHDGYRQSLDEVLHTTSFLFRALVQSLAEPTVDVLTRPL